MVVGRNSGVSHKDGCKKKTKHRNNGVVEASTQNKICFVWDIVCRWSGFSLSEILWQVLSELSLTSVVSVVSTLSDKCGKCGLNSL